MAIITTVSLFIALMVAIKFAPRTLLAILGSNAVLKILVGLKFIFPGSPETIQPAEQIIAYIFFGFFLYLFIKGMSEDYDRWNNKKECGLK